MNTKQLENVLGRICKTTTHGVYACDTLPATENYPALYIVNTDDSNLPGQHWIAIYLESTHFGEYFDSYGEEPKNDFVEYMNKHCKKWLYNAKQIQSVITAFCGFYCLFYAFLRCNRGMTLKDICSIFTNDTCLNDAMVHRFVCKRL